MDKIFKWIEKHKILTFIIFAAIIFAPIIIIHILFKIDAPCEFFVTKLEAGDVLGYLAQTRRWKENKFTMKNIGDISAIATLILFVFYFVGRIWSIWINKKFLHEKIELVGMANEGFENQERFYRINGDEVLKIMSSKYLNWLKVYQVSYDFNNGKYKKFRKPIKKISNINEDEPIYIGVMIPEGPSNIMIKYQRYDYVSGEFLVRFDGRGTGYSGKDYKFRNTLRSYIYYLVK